MNEVEDVVEKIIGYYGAKNDLVGGLYVKKERIFLSTLSKIPDKAIWAGLHIANTDLSLTIEGAQLIGRSATKNTVQITKDQMRSYYLGNPVDVISPEGPKILLCDGEPVAAALSDGKTLLNTLPISRKSKV